MFRFLPEQASDFADKVDWIHNWVLDISIFFTVLIFGAAVAFAIRWRRRNGTDEKTPHIEGDTRLEIIWTVVPTIIIIFVAVNGFTIHREMRIPPKNTLDISVKARMWSWRFEYPNGKVTTNEFTVPVNKPVRLILRSEDVLHSFFLPDMRQKQDAVPGMYTHLWFRPVQTGEYQVYCTEFCGDRHYDMRAKLNVVPAAEYDRWLTDDSEEFVRSRIDRAELGYQLYREHTCYQCHSLDGAPSVGPTFKGLWNKTEKLASGKEITVDENYVKRSIHYPAEEIAAGFAPAMPPYLNILSDDDVDAIIALLKDTERFAASAAAAKTPPAGGEAPKDPATMTPEEHGEALYTSQGCNACHSIDGSRIVGPSFKGLYGKKGALADGRSYVADDEYIKRSILDPQSEIVQGFDPLMMPYKGRITDEEIAHLIAFMKTLQ